MIAALGWLVGIIDVAQFLPQTRHTLGRRHDPAAMRGLSVWTWSIATAQGAAWVVYGFANGLLPIAIPNLVITPACALVLALRLRHGSAARDRQPGDEQDEGPHHGSANPDHMRTDAPGA